MRNLYWKWNFRANFGVLSLGFDVKALIPQGLTGRPNYFGLWNNLMTLIICESLREISDMACVTSAWSSHGQTLNHIPMQNNSMCKVISLNVRGIRDQAKRRSIFAYLKDQKASIYFLQETYSELKDETIWQNEWGGKMYFSHGSRHSKGTCILIDPSITYNVQYSFSNNSGRITPLTFSMQSFKVVLVQFRVLLALSNEWQDPIITSRVIVGIISSQNSSL